MCRFYTFLQMFFIFLNNKQRICNCYCLGYLMHCYCCHYMKKDYLLLYWFCFNIKKLYLLVISALVYCQISNRFEVLPSAIMFNQLYLNKYIIPILEMLLLPSIIYTINRSCVKFTWQ